MWGKRAIEFDLSSRRRPSAKKSNSSNKLQDRVVARTRADELRTQLLGMIGGNEDLANRLIQCAIKVKPFMDEEWYLEKAINDLKRDRSR
jgi:hypothetical protein